jgi:microsomal dipeptidase-like Zn-dependent dipeptidase
MSLEISLQILKIIAATKCSITKFFLLNLMETPFVLILGALILNSGSNGGLIGLSLDTRILGRTEGGNYHLPELFSKLDKNGSEILSPFIDVDAPPLVKNYLNNPGSFEDDNFPIDPRLPHTDGIYYFLNNLLHIAKVAGDIAWEKVCIGSDYDGLIEAISDAPNAEFIPSFYQKLQRNLPQVADIQGVTLPFSVNTILDNLFFDNAKRFFDENFR